MIQRQLCLLKEEVDAVNGMYESEREAAAKRLEAEKEAAAMKHAEAESQYARKQQQMVGACFVSCLACQGSVWLTCSSQGLNTCEDNFNRVCDFVIRCLDKHI